MVVSPRLLAATALVLALPIEVEAADIKLGSRFGDHMVVQRDRPILVWGVADPGAGIDVQFGPRRSQATTDPDGHWSATLDPMSAGGPFVLSASAEGSKTEVKDVLVGDVWLCSGQSNMQMTLKECDGGPAVAEGAGKLKGLRLASVGRKASGNPERDADIRWRQAKPGSAADFSAVGFYFAAALMADPALKDVPIGVIDSSFGGTMCEAWIPKEFLVDFSPKDLRVSMFGAGPSSLYNAMIAPLGREPIRGVVWYQGEGNADRPGTYPRLLSALFASWRDRFQSPDLPFVVIQLPDWSAGWGGLSWAWLREAQATAVRQVPKTALAVGIHTTNGYDLHPRQKAEIGRRAALLALRDVYGRSIIAEGPKFRRAKAEGNALWLSFDTAGDGLVTRGGGAVRGFAVAGADGKYRYADGLIEGNDVVLRSDAVSEPRTARYAWAGVPDANLVNRSGLPAAPFRTDDFPPPDVDVQHLPVVRQIRLKDYEATIDGNGSVTSLGIDGKQFLANGLNGAGGTSVPGWFGPRGLADVREPGPGLVSCSDNDVTLLLEFGERTMQWSVSNKGKDEIRFRIVLAPKVEVSGRAGARPLTLKRGAATLTVEGVEAVTDSDEGRVLEIAVAGRSTKRLVLSVGGR